MIIDFFEFFIFKTNLAMATLGLKEMGKFLWLSQFSFAFAFKRDPYFFENDFVLV